MYQDLIWVLWESVNPPLCALLLQEKQEEASLPPLFAHSSQNCVLSKQIYQKTFVCCDCDMNQCQAKSWNNNNNNKRKEQWNPTNLKSAESAEDVGAGAQRRNLKRSSIYFGSDQILAAYSTGNTRPVTLFPFQKTLPEPFCLSAVCRPSNEAGGIELAWKRNERRLLRAVVRGRPSSDQKKTKPKKPAG